MSELPQISPADLPDDAVILDVREPDEWGVGHAANALHIPLGDLPARLADLPGPGPGPLAVTCRGGGRSSRAVAWLMQEGFDVANLDGGMLAWQTAGKRLVAEGDNPPGVK